MEAAAIRSQIRSYILSEFLRHDRDARLDDDTPLLSGGVIDSAGVLRLVDHLEETFRIRFESHEVDEPYLDTLDAITALVERKVRA